MVILLSDIDMLDRIEIACKLRVLDADVWGDRPGHINTWSRHIRPLDITEIMVITSILDKYIFPISLYTAGNQGVGLVIWGPDPSDGMITYPGVESYKSDLRRIIALWEEHFFPRDRESLNKAWELFRPYVMHEKNQEWLNRYNFPDKEKNPKLSDFEY